VYIPYVKGVSEKFKHIENQYNIRMIFRTKCTCRSLLMKTRLEGDSQQMAQCVYSIPCEHRHNLKEVHLDKSKLAQNAYEEGYRVGWDEARILEAESHSRYRKYTKSSLWHA
jgi:hypothetical protein